MSTVLPYLDAEPFIERYFYFSLRAGDNLNGWLFQSSDSSSFSAIGDLYMGLMIPPPMPPSPSPPPPLPPIAVAPAVSPAPLVVPAMSPAPLTAPRLAPLVVEAPSPAPSPPPEPSMER